MDPQDVINALIEQRNAAANEAAMAKATVSALTRENEALKAKGGDDEPVPTPA